MLALLLVVSGLAGGDAAKVDKAELKKLQGVWALVAHEHGGKKSSNKEIANISLEVADGKFTTRDGVDVKEDASVELLEGKGKPATVELKIASGADIDKVVKGIWKLDGDTLTLCVAEPGQARPKEFQGAEGTGHTLLVFKKAKK